uniref:Uncharacterized protein n=1 Tax=Aegilops tauschii subsp. strangulata TaxID=200361 RepID=A0A453PDU2_AEGTS
SRGGWSFWNMQRNRGLSAASTSTNWVLSATTKNEGYSIWTSAGGEWRPRPTDAHAPAYYHDLAELYLEAARRLPIADIPYLADCISISGLAVGLADPVTNIVLTTINAFAKRPSYVRPLKPDDALEKISKKTTFVVGARDSRTGLIKFLLCYFRNLTQDQAEKCLDVAGHHLPLAVRLVEVGRWGSESEVVPLLQPDAARTRTALRQAAKCSNTDGLVRLMTWRGLGYVLSGDTLVRLKKMLTNGITCVAAAAVQSMAPDLPQSALETLSARRETFKSQQDYVRTKLESLLLDYGRNKGHLYRLGIVCGVTTARYHLYSTCYHVNFLASTDVPNDSTRPWALFFAEFWSIVDLRVEESTNVPFCCHFAASFVIVLHVRLHIHLVMRMCISRAVALSMAFRYTISGKLI